MYSIHVDFDGDGRVDQEIVDVDLTNPLQPIFSPLDVSIPMAYTYTSTGVYLATVWVNNLSKVNSIYSQTGYRFDFVIDVTDFNGLDAQLRGIYQRMLESLRVGDIEGAMTNITFHSQEKYRAIFTTLEPSLSITVDNLGTLTNARFNRTFAEYMLVREVDGLKRGYFIYFFRGRDGIWRIEGM